MIIGIDASRANKAHKSGTEWYSYYLIRCLAKIDKQNEYILYTDKPLTEGLLDLGTDQYYGEKHEEKYDRKGFQIINSPYNNFRGKVLGWPMDSLWTQGRLSWEMLAHRPDILFVPAHTLPVIHPRKSVVTIHDVAYAKECLLYPDEKIGPEHRSGRKFTNLFVRIFTLGKYNASSMDYLRWSTEFALRRAHTIITVSNHSKKDLLDLYKAENDRVKVVYNGYNNKIYKKITDKNKIKDVLYKYGIDKPYLFYVGRLEKKKNIPALIEAYAVMKENNKNIEHKLILAGDASYGYDEAKYMIREYNLLNDVIMPGWLEETDLPYLFNGATAFVFPSRYEGFGIPLLQAMACEVPIVTSNTSSIPEVVGNAAILVGPDDLGGMANALEKVITDKKVRETLVKNGKKRVANFSWENTAEKTLKVLNNMK